MRILFFIDRMAAGGKERRLTELMKMLRKFSTVDFQLAVMDPDIHYKEVLELGIPVHFLIRKTKKDLSIFKKFYTLCKTYKPDIVHCWDSMTAVYSYPSWKLLGFKLVNGMVVDTPANPSYLNKHYARARLTIPISDRVIGNSKAGLKAYGAKEHKSQCIYNGMDLNRFINLGNPDDVRKEFFLENNSNLFVVGMVAAFEDRKDYPTLIKAAISLVNEYPDIRFLLIGGGANLENMKLTVPENMRNRIRFTGKRGDIEHLVNSLDVGVLLTNSAVHGEGISNSIIEYMALSKPVIATTGGGTNEVVFDNVNGYLIQANDFNALKEKIILLRNNPELRVRLGGQGRKLVEERFEILGMAQQYVSMYETLLGKKNSK